MIRNMRILLLPVLAVGLLALAACAGSGEEDAFAFEESQVPGAPAMVREVIREVPVEKLVVVEKEVFVARSAAALAIAPQAAARAAPAPAIMATPAPMPPPLRAPAAPAASRAQSASKVAQPDVSSTEEQVADLVVQRRIIVRTVDMRTVVTDVASAVDSTAELAEEMGGWVVSTNRSEKHRGFISFRVPADRLDETVLRLRASVVDVESEVSTSRDVTDEFVDTQSRLTNLKATEQALLSMLERAEKVEEALKVQESLSRFQEEIERLQGRIKFLEQTSAFSLLNLTLVLDAAEMSADAGEDQTAGVGELVRFRAFFKPSEGIEDFTYTWDFGDGTPIMRSSRTAPTEDEDTRVTATVTHVYSDERDSPYIAQLEITGSGDAGLAEGEDTVIVTVTRLPTISVFAGEIITVREGEQAEFNGSFTRPEGIRDVKYRWTFGDGSSPSEGDLAEGMTNAVATHVYPNHRPFPFNATLTITADSEAGKLKGSATVSVRVNDTEVFAGEPMIVQEGEKVEFNGSFTRPEGVTDVKYRWTFGDGTTPVEGELAEGVTNAVATHVYPDHRPVAYKATLTITARSESSTLEGSDTVSIRVTESEGWVIAGWSIGDQLKIAVRTLSAAAQWSVTGVIWLAIFSPAWVVVVIAAVVLWRRARLRRRSRDQDDPADNGGNDAAMQT